MSKHVNTRCEQCGKKVKRQGMGVHRRWCKGKPVSIDRVQSHHHHPVEDFGPATTQLPQPGDTQSIHEDHTPDVEVLSGRVVTRVCPHCNSDIHIIVT